MPTPTMEELAGLIAEDREIAHEVLSKLPLLVTAGADTDVSFNIQVPPVLVPSIAKLQAALNAGGLGSVASRVAQSEAVTQTLIQELAKLNVDLGRANTSPHWTVMNLAKDSPEALSSNPLYRAQMDNGIRFPFDAYDPKPMDRKFSTDGAKLGAFLFPPYVEFILNRYTLTLNTTNYPTANALNVASYPNISKTVNYYVYPYYIYYYGYYYNWYHAYLGGYYRLVSSLKNAQTLTGSLVAQTFKVSEERVLLAVDTAVHTPGTLKSAAQPVMYVCETAYGMPDLTKILATGSLRANTEADATAAVPTLVTFDLNRPLLLRTGVSYAFVVKASATWQVYTSTNQDKTGQIFFTEDGSYWNPNATQDFVFALRTADFGAGITEWVVDMNNLSVSGGISSLTYSLYTDNPTGGGIIVEGEINGVWQNIAVMNTLLSMPPNVPIRARFTGSRYVMPFLDTQQSVITPFRPAINLKFLTQAKTIPDGKTTLNVVYSLAGFNEAYNTFTPKIQCNGISVTPSAITFTPSSDGQQTKVNAVFTFPISATNYQHDILGSTLVATQLYDVTSVIEMN